ncbi:unnamed protein product [Auanema sp. JU1783]|nr:unnamed protein product [Auanema sp. JU1783]
MSENTQTDCKPMTAKNQISQVMADKKTPWKSIYISIGMQFIVGIQISLYFMSMWPYLSTLEPRVSIEMLGWIVAACSLGCSLANPLFGLWNQKALAVTNPVGVGMVLAAIGQLAYALLPSFSGGRLWIMIIARFVTGCGAGCLSVLRAYLSMASLPCDRLKAISFGTAGYVLGLSLGPAVQACFTPFGEQGVQFLSVQLNMYTLPGYFMVLLSFLSILVMKLFFIEEYAGIIDKSTLNEDEKVFIPKFDVIPALICIYLWMVINMIATNIEVISTPWTVAMYSWNDSQAVTYNAIIQACSCIVSVVFNIIIGYTRIGKIEKRLQIIFGLSFFLLFHITNYPWPFYSGPLDFIPGNSTAEIGGCMPHFEWCLHTVRVPEVIYIVAYILFYGLAFPFVTSPSGTLFSEILGPRKQGGMQGIHSLGGSLAQFISPIIATALFERSGYQYVMVTQLCTVTLATILVLGFYRRLVPLDLDKQSKIKGEP